MSRSPQEDLTPYARRFTEPSSPTHRQYEALRAYFVDNRPSAEVAPEFGYTVNSFRVMCSQFRADPDRAFFVTPARGPHSAPKSDSLRDTVIKLRKQNMSIYDIEDALKRDGKKLSRASISEMLRQEGFAKLQRRDDDERPSGARPAVADAADARRLSLSPRQFRTRFGGIFLFVPFLAQLPLEKILKSARFPGTSQVPAVHAIRSLLALKLFGNARHSHIMSHVFDEGLALFAGLNVIPKRSFLTEYSCRIEPSAHMKLMQLWFDAVGALGFERGTSFDLDFHSIPFHGEDALVEKHYVSKRSRRQKGMLAFLARDADRNVFCYANCDLRKGEQNDEILRFVEYWKKRTGRLPEELIFDSKLTTYGNLDQLNKMGIRFMTLRRRTRPLLDEINAHPASAWRRITLDSIAREYRTPRVLDQTISLRDYEGPLRQLTIADLGHEEPTLLITNQLRRSSAKLVGRYAQRMLIENGIADGVDFFHMDALSSAVAMKVNCDLQLTLMASSLYRMLGLRVGRGYESSRARRIFRDLVEASATVTLTDDTIEVRFQKRAHNPLLLAARFHEEAVQVPWLGNRRLELVFG